MNREEYNKYLEAVDCVCMNCAEDTLNNETICDNCPVRKTIDKKTER